MDPLIQILKRLKEHGVDLVLIGGMAATAHGSPMVTQDVDVCAPLDDDNLRKIIAALRGLNPRWRFRPDKVIPVDDLNNFQGFKNLYVTTDWGNLDVLGELPGICSFDDLRGRTVDMNVGGFTCRVLDLDTLIAAKRTAGRNKDLLNVRHLEVIKLLRAQRPEGDSPPRGESP